MWEGGHTKALASPLINLSSMVFSKEYSLISEVILFKMILPL
jgi:hypothetical protein